MKKILTARAGQPRSVKPTGQRLCIRLPAFDLVLAVQEEIGQRIRAEERLAAMAEIWKWKAAQKAAQARK